MHITALILVVHMLAVHRLIQLWTTDRITRLERVRWARRWYRRQLNRPEDEDSLDQLLNIEEMDDADLDDFARDDPNAPQLVYFAYCWWCFGLWASIGYTALAFNVAWVRSWVSVPLATSTVAVIIAHVVAATTSDDH